MSDDEVSMPVEKPSIVRPKSPRLDANLNSETRLVDLRRQRGNLKSRLTMFEKFYKKLDTAQLDSNTLMELQLRTQSAAEFFKEFNNVQGEIEQRVNDDKLEEQLEYRDQFEQQYYSLMAAVKCISGNEQREQTRQVPSISSALVKLPEIKLPIFDGTSDQWLEFRNSYLTMIHSRQDLDPIHKFHYLRSSLSGCALQVISALEFTAPNYAHAWDLLENRFHNSRLLVQNHVKSLFSCPSVNKESPSQIRKLIDVTLRNLRALKSLNEPTDHWDTLIIYVIVSKLDPSTEREWESYKGSLLSDHRRESTSLKLSELLTFLKNRADMLEMIKPQKSIPLQVKSCDSKHVSDNKKHQSQDTFSYVSTHNNKALSNKGNIKRTSECCLCGGNHALYLCTNFFNMSVRDRWKLVKSKNICVNCMRTSHSLNECMYGPCKLCHNKHNTMLHIDNNEDCNTSARAAQNAISSSSHASLQSGATPSVVQADDCRSALISNSLQPVLLSTALVELADTDSKYHTVRALLDNGSQNCFITEKLCKDLKLPLIQSTIRISGIMESASQSTHTCKIKLRSKCSAFQTDIQCLVLPSITTKIPSIDMNVESIRIPSHIQLADPTFNISSNIDMLIGADIFWDLLNENKIRLSSGPYLHESKVGWIISGPIRKRYVTEQIQCNFVQIDSQLRKFWELEEVANSPPPLSKEDRACERLFTDTTERDEHGRFSVRIPLKESPDSLGESYAMAKNRFLSLERKLERLPQYKALYSAFIREYEELGHMSLISDKVNGLEMPYYILPHHGVYRESSVTTKLRVVFDASAATASYKSLNDIQYVGPPLQNEIFSILLRFRQYQYVVCADIEKFYRQLLIQTDQRNLQLILWRENPSIPVKLYRLNTVTYGTASAPYLSMRCMKQLAQECDDEVIARVISDDFYIDDLITGHDNFDILLDICDKTTKVLNDACLPLRKWMFNASVSSDTTKNFAIGDHCQSKTLGVGWLNNSDELNFTTRLDNSSSLITKRVMLSVISQIYDPLGLLAPVIITAKVMLQKLWLNKMDWDDEVPANIKIQWQNFISSMQCLHEIRVPRHVVKANTKCKQLHIFTDASQNAYGACAYIRSYNDDYLSEVTVRLLCAKTKVAPVRTVSIPRLELCGAVIGAKLYAKILNSLRLVFQKVYFWTDSTIVQGWLRMSPHLLKTFVQNRVSDINSLTGDNIWLHVKGSENPADLLSRGVDLDSLKYDDKSLWWGGPAFLRKPDSHWSNNCNEYITSDLPELKNETVNLHSSFTHDFIDFERFSSFNRLQRTIAYLLRFIHNSRQTMCRRTGPLSAAELHSSLQTLTRTVQQQLFCDEYYSLKNNLPLKIKPFKSINRISGLNIFFDDNNIIRVGGRLSNSPSFSYDKKHPMLLSSKHRFTLLLFTYEHKRLLHAGPQLLVSTLRDRWWVLGARNLARQVVHKCVTCTRLKGRTITPMMGNLPLERIEVNFPFMRCGVDLAGPMLMSTKRGRGAKLSKCYICLFVCFTTRAIHLELVSSLSTQDYLLAFKRFISRRGKPCIIFSDNGNNFVGAEKELSACINDEIILDFATENSIKISFIPPYSPHFGGLWEAGVRSCKYHLRRVMGNARLTYEEFITVLTQIEAVLNSRPLTPMSTDPNDYSPLTPGHFLIGRPLTAPACEDFTTTVSTRLGRYDRVEQLRQHFWERWAKEYVSELQVRTKWKVDGGERIAPDELVVIKEDNLPPLRWKMGRITRIIPGKDGITRVAEIRTAKGIITRACSKICPLPVQTTMKTASDANDTSN